VTLCSLRDHAATAGDPSVETKVRFLQRPDAYPGHQGSVGTRETHMSWVFLAGDKVYKLKKPVRFPYLDFSTLVRREAACRAELQLNRRLAPDVYLDVLPLCATARGLALGGDGRIVDWLVVMRRLDEASNLETALVEARVGSALLDRLAATLVVFYRCTPRVCLSAAAHLAQWEQSLSYNRRVLLDPRLALAAGLVRRIDRAQREFLVRRRHLLVRRVREGRIVDGHGDLRPEHIWLGDPIEIIDCLEFNARLRAVDPFDEIAFLSLECERLGNRSAGERIRRRLAMALRDGPSRELFVFYRCHRATLRARLAIAHLLEPDPRTPQRWPALARQYLALAAADAAKIERLVRVRREVSTWTI
jgi:aminoglycoside phosphotransferase family enzyme